MKRKTFQQLTISSNFLFTEVFSDSGLITELLRRVLPEEEIGTQKFVIKEMTVSPVYLKRGVRFDVYSEDDTHLFDAEMQVDDQKDLFDRAILNLSNMIVHSKDPNTPYKMKGKAYIIFFCAYDETKTGRLMEHYTYKNEDASDEKEQTHIIIVNCSVKAEDHPSIRPFADYVTDGTNANEDPFVQEVETAVQLKKRDKEVEDRYMNYEYELYRAKQEGIEEGEAIGIIKLYDALLDILSDENEAAERTARQYGKSREEIAAVLENRMKNS